MKPTLEAPLTFWKPSGSIRSIDKIFDEPEVVQDPFELEKYQHQQAFRVIAQKFVGRSNLIKKLLEHCLKKEHDSSLTILWGKPGAGKTGVSSKLIDTLVEQQKLIKNDSRFLFVHGVDVIQNSIQ